MTYRPPRPTDAQRVVWPEDFGTRFTVFVDVEEEFDWRAPHDSRNRATTAMAAFPDAHRRFAERGVALNCMIDHPIATDPASVAILSRVVEDGRSEIGTQLHAWVNPPFEGAATSAASYAGNLPRALEAAKLETLTTAITTAFGTAPRAYRAGRYGIGPHSFDLLAALGYRIDSSVRPGYDYSGDGGPDFSMADAGAYRERGIVELPLTTVFTGRARRGGARLYRALGRVPKGRGVFARARLLSRIALTPEDMPIAAALEAVAVAAGEGLRLFNLSFHSPSLAPGHTPYVRDAQDLKRFHAWWTTMLDEFDRRGIRNASLDEIVVALG
ncbi:MAG: WalW protein [Sphingomonas taxi]|uniref:WalW protein n=1 Tax=Sphingomonas taxi TaxID=1549858 RepID=A0A2W5ANV8_9SPHN|nr:MAG: WalW protein [Sphingomonas taxi]